MADQFTPQSIARSVCVACGANQTQITKEHFWPRWLIKRAALKSVRWASPRPINPQRATVPLCAACNSQFGKEIENPMSQILNDLENGQGLSDFEVEVIVRWLWKFEGLSWLMTNPRDSYSPIWTLRDRVLNRLGGIRDHLSLAVSLIDHINPKYGDQPVGIDSAHHFDAIFVSGVFCRTAMMCLLSKAEFLVPEYFSIYRLGPRLAEDTEGAKFFYPRIGFASDTEAVNITVMCSRELAAFHDNALLHTLICAKP